MLGAPEVELWRGRVRTRALEADSQRGMQVPVDVSAPPDAELERRPFRLHQRQHARGRPPLRAGGRRAARPGLVLDPGGRRLLGGAHQPAGRQSAEIRALSQARGAARPHVPWPGRPEDAGHADRRRTGTCRRSTASAPTCCATTAPAAARWRCCSSAPPPRPSASCSPPRSTPIRSISRRSWRSPQKAALPAPVGPGRQRRLGPARQDHGLRRRDVSAAAVAAGRRLHGRQGAGLRLHAPGIGVQSQGALLCRRHGADAADAGHGAPRRQQIHARARRAAIHTIRRSICRSGQGYIALAAERCRQQPGAHGRAATTAGRAT